MAKKIIFALAKGLAGLLVLIAVLVVIISNYSFFGPAITWLLSACVAILILFMIYLTVGWVTEAVRKHSLDEDFLSEEHIEEFLTGSIAIPKQEAKPKRTKPSKNTIALKREQRKAASKEKAMQKQALTAAKKEAETEARRKRQQLAEERKLRDAEARAQTIAEAEEEARARAQQVSSEKERQLALAEAEALRRASMEAQVQLKVEEKAHQEAVRKLNEKEEAEQKAAEVRKAQAIENMRKQAEAAATARRRAAQSAARTQSFSAIDINNLPAFNTQMMEKIVDVSNVSDGSLPLPSTFSPQVTAAENSGTTGQEQNIWEKMQVRQSAAPVLSQRKPVAGNRPAARPAAPKATPPARKPVDETATATATRPVANDAPTTPHSVVERQSSVHRPAPPRTTSVNPTAAAERAQTRPVTSPDFDIDFGEDILEAPKRPRGRPPKPKVAEEMNMPKRPRGRPPKPKTEEELNKPKRPRGRPPKPKTAEEMDMPKRPRGRPRKKPTEEELTAAIDAMTQK